MEKKKKDRVWQTSRRMQQRKPKPHSMMSAKTGKKKNRVHVVSPVVG
jgi:hypothetical protein